MKRLILSFVSLSTFLFSQELVYISDNADIDNLTKLNDKYKQELIISDNRVYLIPQECLLVRHFGGLSENIVTLAVPQTYSIGMPVTQEVFIAKDKQSIDIEIQKKRSMDMVTGKETKEFIEDIDGHLFGGLSEIPIDLSEQIHNEKSKFMKEKRQITKSEVTLYKHPNCELLGDGSGYKLIGIKEAKIFNSGDLKPLVKTTKIFN